MFSTTSCPFDTFLYKRSRTWRWGQDARMSSYSMKADEEMRQLKFTKPGNDRNPAQRKDAGNKQKLAINIVLKISAKLAFKIGSEKNMPQHMERQEQGKPVGRVN